MKQTSINPDSNRNNPGKRLSASSLLLIFSLFPTASASGETIFNNLGAGDSFATVAYTLGDTPNWREAIPFVPSVSYYLTSITVGVGFSGFHDNSIPVMFSIQTDAAGKPSGSVVESYLQANWALNSAGGEARTIPSVLNPTLVAGILYWLVAEPTATSGPVFHTWGWFYNNTGMNSLLIDRDIDPWTVLSSPTPAARIEGMEVPEPSTYAAVGVVAGMAVFQFWRRWSSRA